MVTKEINVVRRLAPAFVYASLGLFALQPALADPVTVEVGFSPARYANLYEQLAEAFMAEHPGVEIVLSVQAPSYDDLTQTVLRGAIVGDMPDVIHNGLNRIRLLADQGLAVPLDPFIEAEADWATMGYPPSIMSIGEVYDTTYAIPFSISVPVVFYNADLVRAAGGDPDNLPQTWEEILALGTAIDALNDGVEGFYLEYTNATWSIQALVFSQGGEFMNAEETAIAFDGPAGVNALEILRAFGEAGQLDMARNQARQSFEAGSLGILLTASSLLTRFEQAAEGNFEVAVGPYPLDPEVGRLPAGGNAAIMLTEDPEERAAAWEYIKFVTGPVGQTIMAQNTGYAPVNIVALEDPERLGRFYERHPNHAQAAARLPVMRGWYAFPGENTIRITDVIEDHLRTVVTLERAPADVMADMQRDVEALLPN